ncbi:hypothetical protein [Streptomyces chartreusis]|uniref:hypothetical protein n=1 Tax=Streptomyces chartreusis TaxID=1969 RepID=UPI002E821DFA|nr:hypothetical protein [Streptomyces chartreusis]WUB23824.1 hypothetical protein OG997_44645 [Streptomyces chartreusis]
MHSFYLFEGAGAFGQGGVSWEHVEVCRSVSELDAAITYYIRTGSWASIASDWCVARVYRHGELILERDLYRFLTVKVPGLTTMRFTDDDQAAGGLPETGGPYDGMDEEAIWEVLAENLDELGTPQDIQVRVDWAGVALPNLVPPVLPAGCGVVVGQRELRYGRNSTLDGYL